MLAKKGVFAVCLMLPILQIFYNLWNWKYISTFNVCMSRAFYLCFFTLNFGVTRVMWYAIPEHVKAIAYPLIQDILPAFAKGVGALITLIMQQAGVAANDAGLTFVMSEYPAKNQCIPSFWDAWISS